MLGVAVLHIAGVLHRERTAAVVNVCILAVRVFILIGASRSPSRVAVWI